MKYIRILCIGLFTVFLAVVLGSIGATVAAPGFAGPGAVLLALLGILAGAGVYAVIMEPATRC